MPNIDPALVPTVNPGALFDRFTGDTQLNIRFYVPVDPVTSSALNRPLGDIALRQLILAKTLDALNIRLGHQALFPFLVQPQITTGTLNVDIPASWIWDMNAALPQKWEKVRLANVRRLSGSNPTTGNDEYTGRIRLTFTAQEQGSTTEVAIIQADYQIDSELSFQEGVRVSIPTSEAINLPAGESETVGGFITFRTLDTSLEEVQNFLDVVTPPMDPTQVDSNGFYLDPLVIQVRDSGAGGSGVSGDFSFVPVSHGTGLLTLNAYNPVPSLDSDVSVWISTFNYPFDVDASLTSSGSTGVIVPTGLFREFNIIAPDNDQPSGASGTSFSFPVWISRIIRVDPSADELQLIFATLNNESPSLVPVEFATLNLRRDYVPDQIVPIVDSENLFPNQAGNVLWKQGFGKGFVVLSDLWGGTSTSVSDFFDSFLPIIDEPPQVAFTQEATRLSSFGTSRVPSTVPTAGQSAALRGSRDGSEEPTSTNRYIVEADQGLGTQIDFSTNTQLDPSQRQNPDIERFGYTGSLAHRLIKMVVNSSTDDLDYDTEIAPRLRILLGRDPVFGDIWFDGTRFKRWTGDAWLG